MAKIAYRRIPVDRLEIFYGEAGRPKAPVILLLHGFPPASQMFRDLMLSFPLPQTANSRRLGEERPLLPPRRGRGLPTRFTRCRRAPVRHRALRSGNPL